MLAIGAVIGAGIFSTIGTAAAAARPGRRRRRPGLVVSFVLLGVVCGSPALCYAEFASMVPQAGSAYTYSYATLGELVAWIIGWDLILEYAVGNIAVAISWAATSTRCSRGFGIDLPGLADPRLPDRAGRAPTRVRGCSQTAPRIGEGGPILLNVPAAFLIVMLITWLLLIG